MLRICATIAYFNPSSRSRFQLRSVPTVGTDLPLLSYISAFRFASHAKEMLHEGYQKVNEDSRLGNLSIMTSFVQYKGQMFKIAMQDRWLVLLTTPEDIEEVRKMSEDKLDFIHAAMDVSHSTC